MKKYIFISIFCVLSSICIYSISSASTDVGGIYENDITWTEENCPYIISSDIVIEPQATLTIEPGTEIYFSQHKIIVRGSIIAQGTPLKKIVFTSSDMNKSFDSTILKFEAADLYGSKLSHIEMNNAGNAIYEAYNTGTLYLNNVKIENAAVVNHSAEIIINSSYLNFAHIDGDCWGSGKIDINDSVIENSILLAGNLHKGITVSKSTAADTYFDVRNAITILESSLDNCDIKTESYVSVEGQNVIIGK
ncbi:hypothetical protein ACFLTD_03665, partial [Elusimicrobiota bacterium]